MHRKPLISIIVPVYNVERYLPQCIDSIIAQTFHDWELILVDDGSTDRSGAICDEYSLKDTRIRVIHKQNSGQADSRNIAIQMAEAELVGFVDSDDWIDPDMYEVLYDALTGNDADIAICGHYLSYKDADLPFNSGSGAGVYTRDEALQKIICDREIKSYLVDKLYRRHVINEFLPKSFYYEDYATLFKWFACADRVAFCNVPKYHYRQRRGSTDHDNDPKKNYHFFLAEKERYAYLTRNGFFPEQHSRFAAKVVRVGLREIKGIIRKCPYGQASDRYIEYIKSELKQFIPVKVSHLGFFRWIMLHMLFSCPSIYRFLMRIRVFKRHRTSDASNLYD